MTIPQNDGFTVVLNRQTGQATYSADADTFSSEIDVFSNQVNDQATEMNSTAIEVNQASNAAVGAANYKGIWADATGAANQGESFLHENQVWVLNVNVADITLSEPSSVNTDWRAIDSSLYQYAVSQLADGDFSKVSIIYAGLTIDTYDYVVYQEDGRIYERGVVTGTFSSPLDFDPDTGIDSGLSGAIENASAENRYAAKIQGASAWSSWIGTGTVTILDAYNVSSITDNGVGNYTNNLSITMATSDFPAFTDCNDATVLTGTGSSQTTTSYQSRFATLAGAGNDVDKGSFMCMGETA